jgi:hypothetical protein
VTKGKALTIIVLGIIVFLAADAYTGAGIIFKDGVPDLPTPTGTPVSMVGRSSASLQFRIVDYVTAGSISAANTKVDIIVKELGAFDFSTADEGITVDAAPETSGDVYAEGDELILHVSSDTNPTGGTDRYDNWFYVKLLDNEPVRLMESDGTPGATVGTYVNYVEGDTNYWNIGKLPVYPRASGANLDVYAMWKGTTLSSVTDGSTWDTSASTTKLTTTDETVWIKIIGGATDVGYAAPMMTLSSSYELQERKAFVIFSTAMTSIGVQDLRDKGWEKVQDSTLTSEVAFYKEIPMQMPSKGNDFEVWIELPIDSSAASSSTTYAFKAWILDFQLEDNVAIGSVSTSIPTAYGMITEFGIDAIIHARAYATSSGAGTTQVLLWNLATPS